MEHGLSEPIYLPVTQKVGKAEADIVEMGFVIR